MADIENVIKGLKCIKGDLVLCVDCGYSDENGHGGYHCKAFAAKDALELLKEQRKVIEQYHKADSFLDAHGWKWSE